MKRLLKQTILLFSIHITSIAFCGFGTVNANAIEEGFTNGCSKPSFITTWKTDNTGTSNSTSITIPTNGAYVYYYDVDWDNDGIFDELGITESITHDFSTADTYTIRIQGIFPQIYFNNTGDKDKIVSIDAWGVNVWETMHNSFFGCTNLSAAGADSPDLSSVTDMSGMFANCSALDQNLENWNIESVTNMDSMLDNCNLSIANYDNTLIGWSAQTVQSAVLLGANGLKYCSAENERQSLIDNNSWVITADEVNCELEYFITTWKTDNTGSSNSKSITIPTSSAYTYNYDVDWDNDGSFDQFGISGNVSHEYSSAGTYTVRIKGTFPQIYVNNSGDKEKLLSIDQWGIIEWSSMENAFYGCSNLTYLASDTPDISVVTRMDNMFSACSAFDADITAWNTAGITNMSGMLTGCSAFNQDLSSLKIASVTDMSTMLDNSGLSAANYDSTLIGWFAQAVQSDVSLGANGLKYCFSENDRQSLIDAKSWLITGDEVNCPLDYFLTTWKTDNPGTSNSTSITIPINPAYTYNYEVDWDNDGNFDELGITGSVTHDYFSAGTYTVNIRGVFPHIFFNDGGDKEKILSIDQWGVNAWSSMQGAFKGAVNVSSSATDNPDLSLVTDMSEMFSGCSIFNHNIGDWNTENVVDMSSMFENCTAFNRNIEGWNTESVTDMSYMFSGANTFNKELGAWIVSEVSDMTSMLDASGLSALSYDKTLIAWSAQSVTAGVPLGAGGLKYCISTSERQSLITSSTWSITGDGEDCATGAFITTWQTDNGSYDKTSIIISTDGSYDYNFDVDWDNDGVFDEFGITDDVAHDYGVAGTYTIRIQGDFPKFYHGNVGDRARITSIDQWGNIAWESMYRSFYDCVNLNCLATDEPDLSLVTNMSGMFLGCTVFNGDISNWNTSNVTNTHEMFLYCRAFDQDLSSWNVEKVTDMSRMFEGCSLFNQYLGPWNTASVTDMSSMFSRCTNFNQDLSSWNTGNVTDMSDMFSGCSVFNQNLSTLNIGNVTNMRGMFSECSVFNQDLSSWNTEKVTNMSRMFSSCYDFNQDLSAWNTGNVTDMSYMFSNCKVFNQNPSSWNTDNVTDMSSMFEKCPVFNQDLSSWNTANVTDMSSMFSGCSVFNQDLSSWNTANVTNMNGMFYACILFNGDVTNWDMANVTNIGGMFSACSVFNQDIGNWNTSNITNMGHKGYWGNEYGVFAYCAAFNQDLSSWNTEQVTSMYHMFYYCTAFDQDLGSWSLTNNPNMYNMLSNSGLSVANYDNTLIGWYNQEVYNGFFWATGLKYCASKNERQALISSYSWGIYGDEGETEECSQLPFITTWETDNSGSSNSTSITIPINEAYGYYYRVDWDNDGTFDEFNISGSITHDFETAGTYTIAIEGTFPQIYFNHTGDKDKLLSIDAWGSTNWGDMTHSFAGCSNLTYNASDAPNLQGVNSLSGMFEGCSSFNGDLSNWYTSGINDMSSIFKGCTSFNQKLDGWQVQNVTDMSEMFNGAKAFNQNIEDWNTEDVTNMNAMFNACSAFDNDLSNWDIANVADMGAMLDGAGLSGLNYDNTLKGWSIQSVQNNVTLGADGLIYCDSKDERQTLVTSNTWDISGDSEDCPVISFVTTWKTDNTGTSNSTSITIPTNGTYTYDYDVDWDNDGTFDEIGITGSVTHNFTSAGTYTIGIRGTFPQIYFNNTGDKEKLLSIDQWGSIAWSDMSNAFAGCSNLTLPATDLPILTNVTDMSSMFSGCTTFNNDISDWNTISITNMISMFSGCSSFNQDLSTWETDNVTNMRDMFSDCSNLDQDLGDWNITNVTNMTDMLNNSGLSVSNYDNTLIGWLAQGAQYYVSLGANGLVYCGSKNERQSLITNYVWDVTGDSENSNTGIDTQSACESFVWIDGLTYTENNNTATYTINNTDGCDSVVTLNLTITNASNTGVDTQTSCDCFTWIDGNMYGVDNNTATYTLTNAAGCDSVVTLDLTVNNSNIVIDEHTDCNSLTWIDGVTYTESNKTATHILTNSTGCDSVVVLSFTILSNTGIDKQLACDSYTWIDGNTYTEDNNTATYILTNIAGCDSVVTLNLMLANEGIDTQTVCESFTWIDGITYTENNNTATHTLISSLGCDSVVTLNLTILSNTGTDTQNSCESFTWIDGLIYTESNNTATYTLTNENGCDSVVTLNLSIKEKDTSVTVDESTLIANANNAKYQWIDCSTNTAINGETKQSFTAKISGNYAVVVDNGACSDTSICYMVLGTDINESANHSTILLYPNPTNAHTSIIGEDIVNVILMNISGEILKTIETNQTKIDIDLSNHPKGIYLINIITNSGTVAKKIVLE